MKSNFFNKVESRLESVTLPDAEKWERSIDRHDFAKSFLKLKIDCSIILVDEAVKKLERKFQDVLNTRVPDYIKFALMGYAADREVVKTLFYNRRRCVTPLGKRHRRYRS